ncbi:MAG: hypothetical protein Kow00105_08170 [Phycisphaeraceae bacterium]
MTHLAAELLLVDLDLSDFFAGLIVDWYVDHLFHLRSLSRDAFVSPPGPGPMLGRSGQPHDSAMNRIVVAKQFP